MSDNSIPFEDDLVALLLDRLQVNLTCEHDGGSGIEITACVFDTKHGRFGIWGRKVKISVHADQLTPPPLRISVLGSTS